MGSKGDRQDGLAGVGVNRVPPGFARPRADVGDPLLDRTGDCALDLADESEEALDLVVREHRGRLVEHEQPSPALPALQRRRDRDDRALHRRRQSERKMDIEVDTELRPVAFRGAVATSDVKALSQISGVGKKTAERIIVELRDKVGAAGAWEATSAKHGLSAADQKVNDAVLALMALGFKQLDAHDLVRAAQAMLGANATIEDLVRACLKKGT